ncbi:MAG: hypothetical protein HFI64_13765 [Lachnospiraceae bacterium]|nr:hypothetical protein [Lachnospiraceae bacterium]
MGRTDWVGTVGFLCTGQCKLQGTFPVSGLSFANVKEDDGFAFRGERGVDWISA